MTITNLRRYIHNEIIRLSEGHWVCQVRVDMGNQRGSHWGKSLYVAEPPFGELDEDGKPTPHDWDFFGVKSEWGLATNERTEEARERAVAWLAGEALDNCLNQIGPGYCGQLAVQFTVPTLQRYRNVLFYVPMEQVSPYAWEILHEAVHTESHRLGEYSDHDESDFSHVKQDAKDLLYTLKEQIEVVERLARGGSLDSVTEDDLSALSFRRTDTLWYISRLRAAALKNNPSLDPVYEDVTDTPTQEATHG